MDTEQLEAARISRRMRLLCIRAAIPMVILLFGGLTFSGFIVPVPPSYTAAQVVAQYTEDNFRIKLGLVISFTAILFLLAFGAAIAAQTRKIKHAPAVLSYMQIASVASGSIVFVAPWVFWQTAAFRLERSPSELMLLNDLGWMFFVFAYVAFTAWNFAIAAAIFIDPSETPVYPRWLAYYNVFVGLVFVPDQLIPFFKRGIFGWNGLVPYWFPFAVYGIWIIVMMVMTTKAIRREEAEEAAATGPVAADPRVPTA